MLYLLWLGCELYAYYRYRQRVSKLNQPITARKPIITDWPEHARAKIADQVKHCALEDKIQAYDQGLKVANDTCYKPLIYYGALRLVYQLWSWHARYRGWLKVELGGTSYWLKGRGEPLLFLHGFGFGVFPYLSRLEVLAEQQLIIAPEFPGVGFNGRLPVDITQFCVELLEYLPDRFHLLSNSYGSFLHAELLRLAVDRVLTQTFVEPVCFYPYFGRLLNFVELDLLSCWRRPTWSGSLMLLASYLLVAKDIAVVECCRQLLIDPRWDAEQHLSLPTRIILAEQDYIIESTALAEYFKVQRPEVTVQLLSNTHHGQAFFNARVESLSAAL